jgi:nitrite reductase/ring-hydroxylating ferredoxin subunit
MPKAASYKLQIPMDNSTTIAAPTTRWYKIAQPNEAIVEGGRAHVRVDGRYITVFRFRNRLSAIDSICYHAGGPLTLGSVKDIEDLGVTVVLCPWHRYMVDIVEGKKAYQAVDIVNGKPIIRGWKLGKVMQRPHLVEERDDGIYVVSFTSMRLLWLLHVLCLTVQNN